MQKIVKFILQMAIIVLFEVIPVNADDGTREYPGPQLSFSPPSFLKLDKLEINIKRDQVSVEYNIMNTSNQDWSTRLNFYIQPTSWYGYIEWYSNRSFKDLRLYINDQPVAYRHEAYSSFSGQDISSTLKAANIDPNLVNMNENQLEAASIEATHDNKVTYQALHEKGFLYGIPEPKTASKTFWILPAWSTSNHYYWEQTFPANSETKITYTYSPLPGVDAVKITEIDSSPYFLEQSGYKNINALLKRVCLTWPEIVSLVSPDSFGYYRLEWLTFPLNKINWAQPVDNFYLNAIWQYNGEKKENLSNSAISVCINNIKFNGRPKMEINLEKVELNEPIVILMFNKYQL